MFVFGESKDGRLGIGDPRPLRRKRDELQKEYKRLGFRLKFVSKERQRHLGVRLTYLKRHPRPPLMDLRSSSPDEDTRGARGKGRECSKNDGIFAKAYFRT